MKLKMILKKMVYMLPEKLKNELCYAFLSIKYPELKEIKKCYGENNSSVTFYVIRPITNSVEGLMSLLYNVLLQISYAEQHKYVPIVDFKNYKTQYNVANENAWEEFFLQPSEYTLDEVYHSRNVILSGLGASKEAYFYLKNRSCNKRDIEKTQLFLKKYIKYSEKIEKILEEETKLIQPEHCIGLYLRGTDYTKMKPVGEPIQPSVEEAIKKVNEYQKKYGINNVFLVTEDESIYKKVKQELKGNLKIASFDSFIKEYDSKDFLARDGSLNQINADPHVRGKNYLVKIILLSKCRCIIGGKTSGSWAASAFADRNTELDIFELGEY